MSASKTPKPTLAGVRGRIRKRNIVHAFDPDQFRAVLTDILARTHSNIDEFFREISLKEEQLDFYRYSTQFFDLLLMGGTGAGEGKLQQGASPLQTSFFGVGAGPFTDPALRAARSEYIELVRQSLRRKPFLERPLDQIVSNLLEAFVSFPEEMQHQTAMLIAVLLARRVIPAKDLIPLLGNDASINNGAVLRMLTEIFQVIVAESNLETLMKIVTDSGLLNRLVEFMPATRRTPEEFSAHFTQAGLPEFVEQVRRRQSRDQTAQIRATLIGLIKEGTPVEEISARMQSLRREAQLTDSVAMTLVYDAIFLAIDWSSRSQQAAEQAQRQLTQFAELLKPVVTTVQLQSELMIKLRTTATTTPAASSPSCPSCASSTTPKSSRRTPSCTGSAPAARSGAGACSSPSWSPWSSGSRRPRRRTMTRMRRRKRRRLPPLSRPRLLPSPPQASEPCRPHRRGFNPLFFPFPPSFPGHPGWAARSPVSAPPR
ncbi:putative eIF5-mimic protein [Paratrimastix pyriformis]|uniref:EIF5-mimic protein n=1 Tax=Paratrimastix pyriformis TaxID=342808 RepID=A0ABQ8UFZ7_9EUKA|nr:putative eIF5-mimic protein [Paratrimastix pyriformis]